MKKFFQIIIITDKGKVRRIIISRLKWNLIKFAGWAFLMLILITIGILSLNINTAKLIKENYELKKKLAELKKIENEIIEFRRVKNELYLALGIDKMPKDSILYQQTNAPDLLEQIDTPFGLPINGIITREHSKDHIGVDIALSKNSFIYATAIGKVEKIDSNSQFGIHIWLSHNKGYKTLYAHLSKVMVGKGDSVKRGQVIGFSGSSGHSTGPHLHYEVWKDNQPIDPLLLR